MPNAVTYSDEKTLPKVLRALMGNDDLEFNQVMGAVDRLQAAGILFREEAEARAPRTPAEAAEDAQAASGGVARGAASPPAQTSSSSVFSG